jgi:hypothetical protein
LEFDYSLFQFNTNLPVSLEMLSVKPINVAEGRRVAISEYNIAVTLDIAKFGLNESFVVFVLLTPPAYGSLHLDRSLLAVKTPFSLYDLIQQKVRNDNFRSEDYANKIYYSKKSENFVIFVLKLL